MKIEWRPGIVLQIGAMLLHQFSQTSDLFGKSNGEVLRFSRVLGEVKKSHFI
jgi:hypothetical protein